MENNSLLIAEAVLHWATVSLYMIATAFFIRTLVRGNGQSIGAGFWLTLCGLFPHTMAIAMRWLAVGHGPYLQKSESLSVLAYGAIAMFLLFGHKAKQLRTVGGILLPCMLVLMSVRLFGAGNEANPPATFTGIWFIIHIIAIIPAMGAFFVALGTALFYILKRRGVLRKITPHLPPLELLDAYNYQFSGFAFLFWSIMIVAGAMWAEQSWGRYWGWDPMETWSFITWLLLGLFLHLRRFFGWQGEKSAWAMVICSLVSLATLLFLPLLTGSIHGEYLM